MKTPTLNTIGRRVIQALTLAMGMCAATSSMAFDYGVSVDLGSKMSDNAFRNEEDKISERQDELGAGVNLQDNQPYYLFDLDYTYNKTQFQKESQQDRAIIQGGSRFRFGRERGLFLVKASHSQERTLVDRAGPDILDNSDERSISNASPEFNFHLSPVDTLTLKGSIDSIRYDQQEHRSSDREGGNINWLHNRSSVSYLGATYEYSEVSYTRVDSEYTYENVYLTYSAALRHLSYTLNLGYNKTEDLDGTTFDAPSYNIQANYGSENYTVGTHFISRITDTSAGDLNRVSLSAENNPDQPSAAPDASGFAVDQYKLMTGDIYFQTNALCLRCSFNVSVGRNIEDYRIYTIENNAEVFSSLSFSYRFARWSSLSYFVRSSDISYDNDDERDTTQLDHRLEWQLRAHMGLALTLLGEMRERSSDNERDNYSENYYGFNLSYDFGKRS